MRARLTSGLIGVRVALLGGSVLLGACGPEAIDPGASLGSPSSPNLDPIQPSLADVQDPIYSDDEFRQAAAGLSDDSPRAEKRLFQRTSADEIFAPGSNVAVGLEPVQEANSPSTAESTTKSGAILPVSGSAPSSVSPIRIGELATQLDAAAALSDDPVSAQFVRALLPLVGYTLGQDPIEVDDFERRTDLTESERRMLHAVAEFSKTVRNRLEEGEAARPILQEELAVLLDAMQDPDVFTIAQAVLATEIRGLGDYTPREGNAFQKGQNHDVRIYMDFDGVQWAFDGINWSTEIQVQVQVLKSDGFRVYTTDWETLRDNRSRRIGVFAWSSITLADDLEIGEYAVKIRVRQPESNQLSERLIPIQIVSRSARIGS